MSNYAQGFLSGPQAGIEAINDITVCVRNWYANLNPLVTRLANIPIDRIDFTLYTHQYRSGSTTTNGAINSNSMTSLTLADASFLMNHDILGVIDSNTGNVEYMWVNGDPTPGSNTITVVRGYCGTSALSSIYSGSAVNLIGNARTGQEVSQTGLATIGVPFTQYCQTFMHPVQVGGSAQTTRATCFPAASPARLGLTRRCSSRTT